MLMAMLKKDCDPLRYMNPRENRKLKRSFYENDPFTVCKDMLGKLIVNQSNCGIMTGEIVETEVYIGPDDKASHAYCNKRTKRTSVQFGERGHAYIFRVYGMYNCFCAVVGPPYVPAVVLVRAVRPIDGIDFMRKNRRLSAGAPIHKLTNGPSKFCQAYGITDELNGIDLLGQKLFLCEQEQSEFKIATSARVGIDYAEEYKDVCWRFYKEGDIFVSKVITKRDAKH
jgi:DNA-3-methyladenine glycosylase